MVAVQCRLDCAVVEPGDRIGRCQTGPVSGGPQLEGVSVLRSEEWLGGAGVSYTGVRVVTGV